VDRHEGRLLKVYLQTGSTREGIEELFGMDNLVIVRAQEQEGVVSVLDHWTRQVIHERVEQPAGGGVPRDELLEDVSHNDEQIRRQRIALAQPLLAIKPPPRNAIQEDSGTARLQNSTNPAAP
jgi:hypothetical protein